MAVVNIGKGRTDVASVEWQGLEKVLGNLNKEISKIEGATVGGLLEAALLIKGDAQRITPVDTGNLKASAYVIWGGGKRSVKSRSNPIFRQKIGKRGSAERFTNIARIAGEHEAIINQRKKHSFTPFAEVGYTAHYAAAVHERLGSSHAKIDKVGKGRFATYRFVQAGQAKFLEQSFVQNERRVLGIIKRRAKIK